MNSWTRWIYLSESTLYRVPEYAGVYEIALQNDRVDYAIGSSATIYFGKADYSIYNRMSRHWQGRGSRRIRTLLRHGIPLRARWRPSDTPRRDECALLWDFEDRHGELPLANIRGCRGGQLLCELDD